MTATPYLTLRDRLAQLEEENAKLRQACGLTPSDEIPDPLEKQWDILKNSITCIALEPLTPEQEKVVEEWHEVLSRLMVEHVLFQYASLWLMAEGYRVSRTSEE